MSLRRGKGKESNWETAKRWGTGVIEKGDNGIGMIGPCTIEPPTIEPCTMRPCDYSPLNNFTLQFVTVTPFRDTLSERVFDSTLNSK
jgi:hypothetical protein